MSRRPDNVLVLGCARSGTTLLYDIMSHHKDIAWISNVADKAPQMPALHAVQRLRHLETPHRRLRIRPCEGHGTWRMIAGERRDSSFVRRTEEDASADQRRRAEDVVARCLAGGRASIFLNKNTALNRQVRWLMEILDRTHIVHVMRQPRDVVASLVGVRFWLDLALWTEGYRTPRQLARDRMDHLRLAARLWRAETLAVVDDVAATGCAYSRVTYDDLVAEPTQVMTRLFGRLGLEPDESVARRIRETCFHRGGRTGALVTDAEWSVLRSEVDGTWTELAADVR